MLDIKRALSHDRLLRATIGLNRQAFEGLLLSFERVYQAQQNRQTLAGKPRKRAAGGGQKGQLADIASKLFFILVYFKCYPTCDVLGVLFDLDYSRANRWVHRLQPILEAALGEKMALPERKIHSVEAFIERFPAVKTVMIDGTERPIARPKDKERQKENYSGKKKRHTRKHLAATDEQKRVLVLSRAREGKVHDKRLLDETEMAETIPDEIAIAVDLGFQGLQNEVIHVHIPHKKPQGGSLSEDQKQENRELSQERVVCENAFAGVKRYRAVSEIYRNRVPDFDDHLMLTACGLWNLYLIAA
jgi:DDE superfamily endonuclease/Helix-turn-helix of DDE superfamily endonuclease